MASPRLGLVLEDKQFSFLYRVIRRLISIHSCQATLEASNEALVKQGRANADNMDLVRKVQKVGLLTSGSACLLTTIPPVVQESSTKGKGKEKKEISNEEDLDVEELKDKCASLDEGICVQLLVWQILLVTCFRPKNGSCQS